MNYQTVNINEFIGKTFNSITVEDSKELIKFITDKEVYNMLHDQDCCETVQLDEIHGDLSDLIGSPIITAEERTNSEDNQKDKDDDSFTWTFYELATIKGSVTIRWYGTSNGYYSESVDIQKKLN